MAHTTPAGTLATLATAAILAALAMSGQAHATIGGRTLDDDDPLRRIVVRLDVANRDGGLCTGVIVGPRQIATAAHCLFDKARRDEAPRRAIAITYYHAMGANAVKSFEVDRLRDLALITMERDHPEGFLVPDLDLREPGNVHAQGKGKPVVHLGVGPAGPDAPSKLTRLDDKPVGLSRSGEQLAIMHSGGTGANGIGTCGGDSGGPVMSRDGQGRLRLLGILQAGSREHRIAGTDGRCTRDSIFTTMATFKAWEREMEAARLAPPSAPSGRDAAPSPTGTGAKPIPGSAPPAPVTRGTSGES